MIIKISLLFLTIILLNVPLTAVPPPSIKTIPSYNSCVIASDSGGRGGQSSFTFYNACNERVYINACANDDFSAPKLYKSFKAIPVGGRFTIYTFPDMHANQIQWLAGKEDPGIPPLCALKKK